MFTYYWASSLFPGMSLFMEVGILVIASLVAAVVFLGSRYEKVGPNEVLIVSGRRGSYINPMTGEAIIKNFKIFHGGGTFILPVKEKVDRMSVELMTLEIKTPEFFTKYGVPIILDCIAQIKVLSRDPIATATAAEMFLSKTIDQMNEIAHQMMQGHLRAVISTLPFEEIHANPEAFSQNVQRLTSADLANMGIQVVSFTIREVQDPSGYLQALGRPQLAEVQKNATVGEAQAQRDATRGRVEAEQSALISKAKAEETARLAQIQAELSVADAETAKESKLNEYKIHLAKSRAEGEMAYELQKCKAEQLLAEERLGVERVVRTKQIEVEDLEIQRKERELVHSVRKPAEAEQARLRAMAEAEAEADRIRGLAEAEVILAKGRAQAEAERLLVLAEAEGIRARAEAEAEGMTRKAEAWKQYNAAAISELMIEKMPEVAQAIAAPLQKIGKVVMFQGGGKDDGMGFDRLTQGIVQVAGQLPEVMEGLTGLDLRALLRRLPGQELLEGDEMTENPTSSTIEAKKEGVQEIRDAAHSSTEARNV
ncbi:MAG: flotillin family protein [Myxococcales bacterium]|nr:flotillin family protein [Myxococcales bacterium]